MCMKCGCGKKIGQKGYGKGPAKKVVAKSKSSAKKVMPKRKAM
jgi:hypothetical protein